MAIIYYHYFASAAVTVDSSHTTASSSSSSVYSPVNTHYKKNICQWQVARKTQEFN